MSDISSIIAKIQKLRALAKSPNLNEAANAAAAAERLITEHQLDEADVAAAETHTPDEACEVHADPLFTHDGERRAYWKEWLAQGLAALYSVALDCAWCRVKVKTDTFPYEGMASRVGFKAIGRKSDVELLRYQYAYLGSEIERLASSFLKANTFAKGEAKTAGNNFRVGAVEGIIDAMKAARKVSVDSHTESHGASAAMVLVSRLNEATELHKRISPEKFREDGGKKGCRNVYSNVNGAAREAGRRAGAALHNAGALNAGSTRRLGG